MPITARVKWFNTQKGYGFVSPDDGSAEAFLHSRILDSVGLRSIKQGAVITCELVPGPKGRQVGTISHVDENAAPAVAPIAAASPDERVVTAKVKYFALHQGYGFAIPDGGGQDIFIGAAALGKSALTSLKEGQAVRLVVSPGKRGPTATRIEIIG